MKYSICLLSILLLAACSGKAQEPTEAEIRTAASKSILQINDQVKEIAAECRGQGSVILNPILALKCTSVCSFDPKNCAVLPSLEITSFKKLACEKAVGQPGWVCAYKYSVSSQSDFVMKMYRNIYGTDNLAEDRFFKTETGAWVMTENE